MKDGYVSSFKKRDISRLKQFIEQNYDNDYAIDIKGKKNHR